MKQPCLLRGGSKKFINDLRSLYYLLFQVENDIWRSIGRDINRKFDNFADRSRSRVLEAILNLRRQIHTVENFTFKIVQCYSHHLTVAINFNRTKELKAFCRR
jgi:hypothetical protein